MAEKFSISLIIEHYTGQPVHQRGSGWSPLCCPVHDEQRPSAAFSEELGKLFCHGCTWKGDGLDLIQLKEGVNYLESIAFAEELTGQKLDGPGSAIAKLPSRRLPARISDGGSTVGTSGSAGGHAAPAAPAGRRRARRIVD